MPFFHTSDLIHWGDSKVVFETRPGYWDADRIGPGAPPIRTEKGWLLIYHGVKKTSAGPIYRLGVALLDIENPAKLIGRSEEPILSPTEYYERVGEVPNVVFTCGAILEKEGEIKIYYGAADTSICIVTAHVDDLLFEGLQRLPGFVSDVETNLPLSELSCRIKPLLPTVWRCHEELFFPPC